MSGDFKVATKKELPSFAEEQPYSVNVIARKVITGTKTQVRMIRREAGERL